MDRIYLDHAATTPMLPEARAAMAAAMAEWANPSSPHAEGRAARAALERARDGVRAALGWRHELIFTSGASEAIALACRPHAAIHASAVEHDAVGRSGAVVRTFAVDGEGRARLPAMAAGELVALQHVNSETGVIQPLDEAAPAIRAAGAVLLADCTQSAGKLPLPDADLIAISAHKLGGPPGIGALLVRDLALLEPRGGQERGYRAGTENLPGAIAFAAALAAGEAWLPRARALRDELEAALAAAGAEIVAAGVPRLATIGSYRMPGVGAAAQLVRLDLAGIAVSAGSACASASLRPSHVLSAMGWEAVPAREVIRASFGPATTGAEIARFAAEWRCIADDAGRRAA